MRESAWFMVVTTLLSIGGLAYVVGSVPRQHNKHPSSVLLGGVLAHSKVRHEACR